MGLKFPVDLEAWRRWDASRRRVQRVAGAFRGRRAGAPPLFRATKGAQPPVAVVLESRAASSLMAFLAPTRHLESALVLSPFDPTEYLPGVGWSVEQISSLQLAECPEVRTVVAAGNYLALSGQAFDQARALGLRFAVVQHGLVTPFSPPLPSGAQLLAWSAADAEFWRSGRKDIATEVVGAQLLWEAAQAPRAELTSERPIFLGQLHGAELPRFGMTRAAIEFCRTTGATYRPHPSEVDLISRLEHRAFRRLAIEVDPSPRPLATMTRPIAAAYSTGLLEAVARGLPAWAFYPDPPTWLSDFWSRYGLSKWGQESTRAQLPCGQSPAARVAELLS